MNTKTETIPEECPICLEEFDEENPKHILDCNHEFHCQCLWNVSTYHLDDLQRYQIVCPMCRQLCRFNPYDCYVDGIELVILDGTIKAPKVSICQCVSIFIFVGSLTIVSLIGIFRN